MLAIYFVPFGGVGRFPGVIFENVGVVYRCDFQLLHERESPENIEIGLLTYFHMARSILLQRRRLATRRLIQMGRRNYILEIRFVDGYR